MFPPSLRFFSGAQTQQTLLHLLQRHIHAAGPMPVPVFTQFCLHHPTLGYYSRTDRGEGVDPFGWRGDFITSPEISSVFGQLLAVWAVTRWQAAGCPRRVRLVELGPGRGTLMVDVLRTLRSLKSFGAQLSAVHLVENSPFMRHLQCQKLSQDGGHENVFWHDGVGQVPPAKEEWTMLFAHEFFDALPVHIFQQTSEGFREVLVDTSECGTTSSPKHGAPLRFVLSSSPTRASQTLLTKVHGHLSVGARVEISPSSSQAALQAAQLLQSHSASLAGGAGLIVDYGDDHHFGNSFRGFYRHQLVDPLSNPGLTDLTANVDFASLRQAMEPLVSVHGPITQRDFLLSMGIEVRTKSSDKGVQAASERLLSPLGMGGQYKVLGLSSPKRGDLVDVYPFPKHP